MAVDVTLCIAGLARAFRFRGSFRTEFVRKYRSFIAERETPGVIDVCTLRGVASHLDDRVEVSRHRRGLLMQRNGFRALLDHEATSGTLEILPELMVFDSFLRVLYSHVLLHAQGLLLHSSGVIRNGRGYVFTGVSGAGKTTISKMPAGNLLLSDGVVGVRPNGKTYSVHGTPFQGEIEEEGAPASAPVSQLFFLNKAPRNFTTSLGSGQATQKLLRSTISYPPAREEAGLALARVVDVLASIRFSNLHFVPDPSIYDFIDSTETGIPRMPNCKSQNANRKTGSKESDSFAI